MKAAFVVFCSPAGSTRHVAGVIAEHLKEKSITVHQLDLGVVRDSSRFIQKMQAASEDACLFVGSPVYRDVAIPPVMAFIDNLPGGAGCPSVPFVTWGGALSGIALWQMGKALDRRGFTLVGAAKVLGVHSMMWPSDCPVGQGHPDAGDDRQVGNLVEGVIDRLAKATGDALSLDALDYQMESISTGIKKRLGQPWMIIPKTIDEKKCTQCAICKQVCPVGAVTLDPGPVFDDRCFDCFSCIRECPEEAIISSVPLAKIQSMIRQRVEAYNERPFTQIF